MQSILQLNQCITCYNLIVDKREQRIERWPDGPRQLFLHDISYLNGNALEVLKYAIQDINWRIGSYYKYAWWTGHMKQAPYLNGNAPWILQHTIQDINWRNVSY